MASMSPANSSNYIEFSRIIALKTLYDVFSNGDPFMTEEDKTRLIRLLQESANDLLQQPLSKENESHLSEIQSIYQGLFPEEKERLPSEKTQKEVLEKWTVAEVNKVWKIFFTKKEDFQNWAQKKIASARSKLGVSSTGVGVVNVGASRQPPT